MLGPTGPLQAATDRSLAPIGRPPVGLGLALGAAGLAAVVALLASVALPSATVRSGAGAGHAPRAPAAAPHWRGALSLAPPAPRYVSVAPLASAPAYAVRPSPHGLVAVNPAQGLRVGFGTSGTALHAGALRFVLSRRATGYGSSLNALAAVAPSASANRVAYAHAD